eukprot:TRINITY_DN13084_c0_g1_i1.p1 TRINITY_DN13084_c0_g1~~TRINITY_DN13084_c0_g1_i1.p1  ORF type:complete len:143 (-),score=12.73 TRINITY_DN13084_c0_g1_i1:53-481(-)
MEVNEQSMADDLISSTVIRNLVERPTTSRHQSLFLCLLAKLLQSGRIRECRIVDRHGEASQGFCLPRSKSRRLLSTLYEDCCRRTGHGVDPSTSFRAATVLLSKCFVKVGPYTYTYKDNNLYIPGETDEDTMQRFNRHLGNL